jgi:hypothetical protein
LVSTLCPWSFISISLSFLLLAGVIGLFLSWLWNPDSVVTPHL